MPPRQEKRGRGRGKRPRDEEGHAPASPQNAGFSAINSPSTAAPIPQTRFGQHQPASQSGPSIASTIGPFVQQSMPSLSQAPPGKVAIPALKNPRISESSKALKKGRTPHACDYCRRAKAGCTGGNPCARCLNANVSCVYGDGKRDKDKKRMTKLNRESISLSRHNDEVTEALRRIRLDTKLSTEDIRSALDDVISMTPTPVSPDEDEGNTFRAGRESSEEDDEEAASGNEDQDMEVGSTGSLDVTNMNTDRDDIRATGHMGKSSAVAWAKRTVEATKEGRSFLDKTQSGLIVGSYHTEDADIQDIDTTNIDYLAWPIPEVADALVQCYFETVHPSFPIVDKASFIAQYKQFDRTNANLSPEDCLWLGSLNVIFAIGAVHAHLTGSPHRGHYYDHMLYVARAKILCFNQTLLFEDARVNTISALGLLCLYFISTCRLNRAWTICGLAMRDALTLGLHVRSRAEDVSDYDKECRVRLWWSLYSLECLLNKLTGRPSCISDRDISTPPPINIDDEEFWPGKQLYAQDKSAQASEQSSRRSSQGSKDLRRQPSATYEMPIGAAQPLAYTFPVLTLPTTDSTYFIYQTQLAIISHEIITQLYCAATIKERWVEVQGTIRRIDTRLNAWCDNLPEEFSINFDRYDEPDWSDPHVLPRMGLAMLFNSSRMILFRPCLCKFEGRMSAQSEKSMNFNQDGVKMCIHSARTMINLIGWTSRKVEKLYAVTPWWQTLHYLCEALSVLMLELAYKAQHLPTEAGYILDDAKKGIRWLIMMSAESISARKAWEIFDSLVRIVAPRINWSLYDLPTTAPAPLGYTRRGGSRATGNSTFPNQQMPQSNISEFDGFDPQLDLTQSQTSNPSSSSWSPHTFGLQPSHTFAPTIYGQELIGNPLGEIQAIQMFGGIGALHGHYDEPWHHMFGVDVPGVVPVIQGGGGMMGPPPPPEHMQGAGNLYGDNFGPSGEFDDGFTPYGGLSGGGGSQGRAVPGFL